MQQKCVVYISACLGATKVTNNTPLHDKRILVFSPTDPTTPYQLMQIKNPVCACAGMIPISPGCVVVQPRCLCSGAAIWITVGSTCSQADTLTLQLLHSPRQSFPPFPLSKINGFAQKASIEWISK